MDVLSTRRMGAA